MPGDAMLDVNFPMLANLLTLAKSVLLNGRLGTRDALHPSSAHLCFPRSSCWQRAKHYPVKWSANADKQSLYACA